jgi:hypothetical protein
MDTSSMSKLFPNEFAFKFIAKNPGKFIGFFNYTDYDEWKIQIDKVTKKRKKPESDAEDSDASKDVSKPKAKAKAKPKPSTDDEDSGDDKVKTKPKPAKSGKGKAPARIGDSPGTAMRKEVTAVVTSAFSGFTKTFDARMKEAEMRLNKTTAAPTVAPSDEPLAPSTKKSSDPLVPPAKKNKATTWAADQPSDEDTDETWFYKHLCHRYAEAYGANYKSWFGHMVRLSDELHVEKPTAPRKDALVETMKVLCAWLARYGTARTVESMNKIFARGMPPPAARPKTPAKAARAPSPLENEGTTTDGSKAGDEEPEKSTSNNDTAAKSGTVIVVEDGETSSN